MREAPSRDAPWALAVGYSQKGLIGKAHKSPLFSDCHIRKYHVPLQACTHI
jgi:hypothetical protein